MVTVRTCPKHGDVEFSSHKDKTAKSGQRWRCKQCQREYTLNWQKLRMKRVKSDLIQMFGGKCILCGYDKSVRALCFHHRDPSTKLFSISQYQREKGITWDSVVKEAQKCDLLCANCHAEQEDEKYIF